MFSEEKILVARQSGFQTILLTEDRSGLRILRFGEEGASQSVVNVGDPSHLALPYARLLPASLAFCTKLERMLIIGLGGGSLARFFRNHFREMTIDVVELDPAVVDVARDHCGFEEDSQLRVHVDDGRDFIESKPGSYDVIILDTFDADSIPAHLTTLEFLNEVKTAVTPAGIVVANVWGSASNPAYADMLLTYRATFDDVYIFDVPAPGTKLFVALNRTQEISRAELIRKCDGISERHAFKYDLSAEVAGFRNARQETVRGGSVLRD